MLFMELLFIRLKYIMNILEVVMEDRFLCCNIKNE